MLKPPARLRYTREWRNKVYAVGLDPAGEIHAGSIPVSRTMDIETIVTILAGGMFGVLLGKLLDTAPPWAFWLVVVGLFGSLLYLTTV